MLRAGLLALSRNRAIPGVLQHVPLARRLPRRFVAGETLDQAIAVAQRLNERGFLATIDHLGEHVATAADAMRAADEYVQVVRAIQTHRLQAGISIKLTHLGLDLGQELCLANSHPILRQAEEDGHWVEIDMEGSAYTERTLEIFHRLRETHEHVGVCVQAYLYRTEEDLGRLIERGAKVRLCKGAYDEPEAVAFPHKADVDRSYERLLGLLFGPAARETGVVPAVATHDLSLIDWVRQRVEAGEVGREDFEFQMLYGVRRALQAELVEQGYQVRIYVPFGSAWYPYLVRRLAERPANLLFMLRQLPSD